MTHITMRDIHALLKGEPEWDIIERYTPLDEPMNTDIIFKIAQTEPHTIGAIGAITMAVSLLTNRTPQWVFDVVGVGLQAKGFDPQQVYRPETSNRLHAIAKAVSYEAITKAISDEYESGHDLYRLGVIVSTAHQIQDAWNNPQTSESISTHLFNAWNIVRTVADITGKPKPIIVRCAEAISVMLA